MGHDDDSDSDDDDYAGGAIVPLSRHKCTDVFCFVLLIAVWIAMSLLGMVVTGAIDSETLPKGDPRRLIYGLDYLGQLCSVDDDQKFSDDGALKKYDVSRLKRSYFLPSGALICVDKCPGDDDPSRFLCEYDVQEELDAYLAAGDGLAYYARGLEEVATGSCNFHWQTTRFLNACVFDDVPDIEEAILNSEILEFLPTAKPTVGIATLSPTTYSPTVSVPTVSPSPEAELVPCTEQLDSAYCNQTITFCPTLYCATCVLPGVCDFTCGFCASPAPTGVYEQTKDASDDLEFYERIAADIVICWREMLFFSFCVATILGLVYLTLLQIPYLLSFIVWVLLIALLTALLGLGALVARTSRDWQREDPRVHSSNEVKGLKALATIILVLSFFYFCLLIAMRARIVLATNIIKEGARALSAMPALIMTPLLQGACLLGFCAIWVFYALYLASSGEVKTVEVTYGGSKMSYKEFAYSREQQYAAFFLLFCYFWTAEFIAAMGQLLVAAAVVRWYFTRGSKPTICTPCELVRLGFLVFFKHAGTAAFGGLLVAIIRLLRAIVTYIQNNTKAGKSKLGQILLSCVQCYLYCMEKCVRYINKMAYVQTAIHGVGLCSAGLKAFQLMASNGLRVLAVSTVSSFVLAMGKLGVASLTAFGFYVYVNKRLDDDLHSLIIPTIIVFVLAFTVAGAFNDIFDMVITSILQCFVTDEADFKDDPYATGALRKAINSDSHKRSNGWCCCCGDSDDEDFDGLRRHFDEYDADGSGQLEKPELAQLLEKSTGATPSESELEAMMKAVDKDGSGTISYREFVSIREKAVDGKLEFKSLKDAMLSFESLVDDEDDDDEAPKYSRKR